MLMPHLFVPLVHDDVSGWKRSDGFIMAQFLIEVEQFELTHEGDAAGCRRRGGRRTGEQPPVAPEPQVCASLSRIDRRRLHCRRITGCGQPADARPSTAMSVSASDTGTAGTSSCRVWRPRGGT